LSQAKAPVPPVAERRPHSYERHGYTVEDPYHWLKDQKYPQVDDADVLAYLTTENDYFNVMMQPHQALVTTLFEEMKARLKEDDASVPQKDGDWLYWWDFVPGSQYRRWLRRPVGGGADVVILDENSEAEGKEYFRLGAMEVSPDGQLLAWTADSSGAERFVLKVRDLATGQDFGPVSSVVNGALVWTADSRGLLYTEVNENWRTFRALHHVLETDPATDRVLYQESDEGFRVAVGHTQDRHWLVIATGDHETTESRLIPSGDPTAAPMLVSPRKTGRQYSIDSAHGRLWILTNDDHVNFRLAQAAWDKPAEWSTVIAGSDRVYLRGVTAFRDHLLISERVDGLDQVRLRDYAGEEHRVAFPEASYTASPGTNPEYAQDQYRLGYSSMVTPNTVYDYDWRKRELIVRKVQEIPSGYDASLYATERLLITARDGQQIPVSVVYRKSFVKNGEGPLMLYAPMASPIRRASRPSACRCSTAASPMPSRISGAATISAMTGIYRARPRSAGTPSTIFRMWRRD
jgi:oligopeptidase B